MVRLFGHATTGAVLALACLSTACVPTEFEDLRLTASTVALHPPDGYPSTRFGSVVTGYSGTVRGTVASRVGFSAGEDSPFTVYPVLIGEELRLDTPVLDGCDDEAIARCEAGAGSTLVGFPGWGGREVCLATFATATGDVHLRCEDDVTTVPASVSGPSGVRFGESAAALRADHPFGRAVVGAPGGSAIYRLPDRAAPVAIDLSLADGVGGELGAAVAVAPMDGDSVLLAAGATGGPTRRVVVATSDVAGDGTVTTAVRGCLDEASAGWGGALAIGDLDGDGALDVVVGSRAVDGRLDAVRVFSGADLPAADTCDASWSPAVELSCPSVEDVGCADAAFGSVLTIGDLNGDGTSDLVVGAPGAEVDSMSGAGVAFVFAGGALASLGSADRVAVLRHPRPTEDAALGAALGVAPGLDGRDEVAVGAPGIERGYVFLCSGLDGDSEASTAGDRCQPRGT